MIYQAYVENELAFEGDSFKELFDHIVQYHRLGHVYDPRPVPMFSKVCSVDEDDNETLYDAVDFSNSVAGQV